MNSISAFFRKNIICVFGKDTRALHIAGKYFTTELPHSSVSMIFYVPWILMMEHRALALSYITRFALFWHKALSSWYVAKVGLEFGISALLSRCCSAVFLIHWIFGWFYPQVFYFYLSHTKWYCFLIFLLDRSLLVYTNVNKL